MLGQIKGREEARVYAKDVKPAPEQGRGQGLRRVTGPEIRRQRWEEVPGIRVGIVYLHSETIFDIDQVPDKSDAADDDEPRHAPRPIIGNAQEGVDPGESERWGHAPGALEDSRVGEVGGGGEEEAVGAEEAGGGRLVVARGEDGEAEPEVGNGVEGEGLVVLG
ncbi:hypothetical protein PanWU01x14_212090 [Parasponia andersonii]|uniref:Uncharacterized protein n=1 Tax=Parasponia andersonii TaxID=3476 RepID=A0A2P5BT46_PARAD|nr:hypothetical protein PanWU01x14_212090 [Parasponia andersonii]